MPLGLLTLTMQNAWLLPAVPSENWLLHMHSGCVIIGLGHR